MAQFADQPWPMYAAMLAGLTLVVSLTMLTLFLWVNFGRPWNRARLLKRPCDVHFQIRSLQTRSIPYAKQDDLDHRVKELVLPSHSEGRNRARQRAAYRLQRAGIGFRLRWRHE